MIGVTSDRPDDAAPNWFIDELDYAGRENLDASHVERYDAKEDASAESEVALLKQLGLTRESLVVEIGAGTGQFSVEVAPECDRVIAVDVSPLMLRRLQAKVTALGLSNIELVRAGFLTYEHTGRRADFIYSRFALHHLPDFWKALALTGFEAWSPRTVSCACGTSSTTSLPRRLRLGSRPGVPLAAMASRESGADPSSKSTFATSTPLSAGCSSR